MKLSPFFYIALTTVLLVVITMMCALDFSFHWVFYLTMIGQVLVLVMVYKVLTDKYKTNKTFEHFYEDKPVKPLEVNAENENFR